ncbi:HD domain-containing protein [Desulfosarcina ovata]|uniref:Metal-dependent phosphohydrolase n=1 Tax=Desulfosarcina ovata subsp. ovata TaxID=2752305 RepID=A0A5K8A4E3_9BACT|nr:HD domain-containing protein [Desulfosarcina ovata]BBO87317.1 metal-dependent phosphohydrolase [Desulfosarcina ovata subsp. ovata]
MLNDQLIHLKSWFHTYSHDFLTGDAEADGPHTLKIDHTARVCENICHLARSIGMTERQQRMAEAVGLFHDVGRFEQYQRFGTFNDHKSVNHAALGVKVLETANVLDRLDGDRRALLLDAIRFHNAPALPGNKPAETTLFMRLIRDADKLDIWKVFADYYRHDQVPEPAIVQYLADTPACSDAIIDAIGQHRMAKFQHMRSINDFKLLQLSWVFDIQFIETLVQAGKRGDLRVIADSLPDNAAVQGAVSVVMAKVASATP